MALYIDSDTAALLGQARPLGLFWYCGLDEPLRYWMGFGEYKVRDAGDYETGLPSLDAVGDKYIGLSRLPNLPDLEVLVNGRADRVEFGLSGVSDEVLAMVAEDPPSVTGREVRVGIAPLDDRWQPLSMIVSLWCGTADFTSINQPAAQGSDMPVNVVLLSCYSGGAGRARPKRTTYTSGQQKALYPDDKGCDNIPTYRVGFQLPWP